MSRVPPWLSYFLFSVSILPHLCRGATNSSCKPTPSSPDWPSAADWQALNKSVSGNLIATIPPGAVCQPHLSQFNNASCTLLLHEWANSSFHASDPVSVDYNDDTCLPSPLAPCSAAGYPVYVVKATKASDIQEAVMFARKTGVRLVVKGTGHDFLGRSSGPNSLSIWTHNIRGVEVHQNDSRAVALGGVASVKISAGMRMFEVYSDAVKNNITVVGGGDLDVGIGGWITGGGHSPISSKFGLGADQVLEMEVVTADGELRTVNSTSNPGLFWAMRGGGGSTFGVMVSVTVKAYPSLPGTHYLFSYNTTADSDTFWSLVAFFHTQLPSLSESGVMGYYYAEPNTTTAPDTAQRGTLFGIWIIPEKTVAQTNAIIKPIEAAISSSNWPDKVSITGFGTEDPDFTSAWLANVPESVGVDGRLGSRLLGREALTGNYTTLKALLKQTTPAPWVLLGNLVAGPGVREVAIAGGSNAVNPAWRTAYVHLILPRVWPYLNITAKNALTDDLRNVRVQALRELAPHSGAYVNEADPTEPNWQQVFWGSNYPRLLDLKKKWDPHGVFWCRPCVGNELWTVTGADGLGQDGGTICRK